MPQIGHFAGKLACRAGTVEGRQGGEGPAPCHASHPPGLQSSGGGRIKRGGLGLRQVQWAPELWGLV